MVGIQAHQDALDRLQILGFEHTSRHLHGINHLARGETVGIVSHRIALVVIADGIREVDGIGGVGLEGIDERNGDSLSASLDFRHFQLWRRHHHLLRRIIQLDELIEVDIDFLLIHFRGTVARRGSYHLGRSLVKPSAIGLSHLGTGSQQQEDQQIEGQKQGVCLHLMHQQVLYSVLIHHYYLYF